MCRAARRSGAAAVCADHHIRKIMRSVIGVSSGQSGSCLHQAVQSEELKGTCCVCWCNILVCVEQTRV